MEKTLQHQETTQCFGLPPTGSGNHRPDGPGTGHALTFILDHLNRADQYKEFKVPDIARHYLHVRELEKKKSGGDDADIVS